MKEYVFKNDKLLMIYAAIIAFLFGFNSFSKKLTENFSLYLTILTLMGVIFVIALFIFTRVTYRVSEEGIGKRGQKKLYPWDSLKQVVIGKWFIDIKTNYGDNFQIISPTDGEDVFEQLKGDVFDNCNPEIISYDDEANPINLGLKGSIIFFYIEIIWLVIYSAIADIIYALLIGLLINNLWVGLSIYIIKLILGILLIIFIPLKKRASIMMTKIFLAINMLFYCIVAVSSMSYQQYIESAVILISLVAYIPNILVFYRYLNVSKRVKNYFVK